MIPKGSDSRPLFCCSLGPDVGDGFMVATWEGGGEKIVGDGTGGATTVTKTVGEDGGGGSVRTMVLVTSAGVEFVVVMGTVVVVDVDDVFWLEMAVGVTTRGLERTGDACFKIGESGVTRTPFCLSRLSPATWSSVWTAAGGPLRRRPDRPGMMKCHGVRFREENDGEFWMVEKPFIGVRTVRENREWTAEAVYGLLIGRDCGPFQTTLYLVKNLKHGRIFWNQTSIKTRRTRHPEICCPGLLTE